MPIKNVRVNGGELEINTHIKSEKDCLICRRDYDDFSYKRLVEIEGVEERDEKHRTGSNNYFYICDNCSYYWYEKMKTLNYIMFKHTLIYILGINLHKRSRGMDRKCKRAFIEFNHRYLESL